MKALIVIEMPDDAKLDEWFAKIQLDRMRVPISEMYGVIFDEMKVINFVPLRPLPSFKAVDLNDTRDVMMFCHGWNVCLEEIEK